MSKEQQRWSGIAIAMAAFCLLVVGALVAVTATMSGGARAAVTVGLVIALIGGAAVVGVAIGGNRRG